MTAELRTLWQEAFGDSPETMDKFAATGFSPDRFHAVYEGNRPVSALYWFDCQLDGYKFAYIYAVATLKSHRGRGLAQKLMEETHKILKDRGYAGTILVPEEGLFPFYEKIGYKTVTKIDRFTCLPAKAPTPLREIDATEYARLRRSFLPPAGVIQEGAALAWLHTYTKFYAGEGFLLAGAADANTLLAQEFLGDTALAGGILTALGMANGIFRAPGAGQNFAMYYPFTPTCPIPGYFGLALD